MGAGQGGAQREERAGTQLREVVMNRLAHGVGSPTCADLLKSKKLIE
jgi:hypothetical protein